MQKAVPFTGQQRADHVLIAEMVAPGSRVLDVGCGPGFLCESMAGGVGRGGTVTGIDLSGDLIARCRRRNPPDWLSYAVADATEIAQPDGSFDVITCTQVAEYIPDVDRALSEAHAACTTTCGAACTLKELKEEAA